jgi:tripartite-type tricarboxylate transporter receptor subunit TctC
MGRSTVALVITTLLMSTGFVRGEDWPTHPLTMINPFAAGGSNDVVARLFAQRMGEVLGQPVIVENVAGTVGTQAQNQTLFRKPAYNQQRLEDQRHRRSPEYLGKFVESEIVKWAAPIKASGATAD